jgi:formamidopyrimidine-DNA glycosylase
MFQINNKQYLYFVDQRHFGTFRITSDKSRLDKILGKLGPDMLQQPFTNKEFYQRIDNYMKKYDPNRKIIKILMDQSTSGLGSGLGNYLSVEVLYLAKISPHTKIKKIYDNLKLSNKLATSIKYIVKLAYMTADIGYFAILDNNLSRWITKLRKTKKQQYHPDIKLGNKQFIFQVYRQKYDSKGNMVKADKIIKDRTTYWVPSVQK